MTTNQERLEALRQEMFDVIVQKRCLDKLYADLYAEWYKLWMKVEWNG